MAGVQIKTASMSLSLKTSLISVEVFRVFFILLAILKRFLSLSTAYLTSNCLFFVKDFKTFGPQYPNPIIYT